MLDFPGVTGMKSDYSYGIWIDARAGLLVYGGYLM